MDVPKIWIMGGPGSGKGTQSQKIVEKYGFKHIDPVALVEEEINAKTPIGKRFQKSEADGNPIRLPEIVPLIEQQLMSHRGPLKGFVIDGYPADMVEAQVLENGFGSPSMIIALELEKSSGRTSISTGPTARPSLNIYIDGSKAVMEHYAQITLKINAEQEPENIFTEIQKNMDTVVKRNDQIEIAR